MNTNKSLEILVNKSLPVKSTTGLTYNAERNMFLTQGYTSSMGHTYFQGIQLSNRLAIVNDIGRGGWGSNPLFLNGVTLYCFDGKDKKIIGKWAPSNWAFYSESLAISVAKTLLNDYLVSQMKMQGISISQNDIDSFVSAQIRAAVAERPAISA